jgi:predicted phosphodiesterase
MKIQVASDLHLEFPINREFLLANPIEPTGDILVLAGDIANAQGTENKEYQEIVKTWQGQFDHIIQIDGNHDYYRGTISRASLKYKTDLASNHVKLNNEVVIKDNVRFICTTLWSNALNYSVDYIADFSAIRGYTPEKNRKIHDDCVEWLEDQLKLDWDGPTIVVTHHLPSEQCVDPMFKGSPLNCCFASDQEYLMEQYQIDYWIYGHTHFHQDFTIGDTHLLCNPLGYVHVGENGDFRRDFTFDV